MIRVNPTMTETVVKASRRRCRRRCAAVATSGILNSVGTVTQTTVSGLTSGTTYTFRVAAKNVAATGAKSADSEGDILVEGRVLLELKSARVLEATHEAQLLHYLKSTQIEIGLLLPLLDDLCQSGASGIRVRPIL